MTSTSENMVRGAGDITAPSRISIRKDIAKKRGGAGKKRAPKRKPNARPDALEPDPETPEVPQPAGRDDDEHHVDCLV